MIYFLQSVFVGYYRFYDSEGEWKCVCVIVRPIFRFR